MSEGHVIKACIQLLCLWKCDIIRNNSGAIKTAAGHWLRFGKKDSGDIIACSPYGRWIEIECKYKAGAVRIGQEARQRLIQSMGGVYLIARDNTRALEEHKEEILARPSWAYGQIGHNFNQQRSSL